MFKSPVIFKRFYSYIKIAAYFRVNLSGIAVVQLHSPICINYVNFIFYKCPLLEVNNIPIFHPASCKLSIFLIGFLKNHKQHWWVRNIYFILNPAPIKKAPFSTLSVYHFISLCISWRLKLIIFNNYNQYHWGYYYYDNLSKRLNNRLKLRKLKWTKS